MRNAAGNFTSAELMPPAWRAPLPLPETGIVLKVYPAGTKLAGKCCYDVGLTTTGAILYWVEAAGSGREQSAQYEKNDYVRCSPVSNGQWIISGGIRQDGDAPSRTGESGTLDPEGRGHSRTDAQGRSYQQSRGLMALTATAEGALRPDDQYQTADDAKKSLIENLPEILQGPLYAVVYQALLPVLAGAVSGANVTAQARLAGLSLLGSGAEQGFAWAARETGKGEAYAAARKLTLKIIDYIRKALAVYRLVSERMKADDKLPSGEEIYQNLEKELKNALPGMLIQIVTTNWKGKETSWRSKSKQAVTLAQAALMPVIMQALKEAIGI